jgi:hypothetical protein
MKVCYEVYSFELNLLIIHLRNYEAFFCFILIFTKTNVLLKNMVVYDVLTFLQTMAFVCSTCVDLNFGVESSLLVQYCLFGVVLISYLLFSET